MTAKLSVNQQVVLRALKIMAQFWFSNERKRCSKFSEKDLAKTRRQVTKEGT